jgi:integrase
VDSDWQPDGGAKNAQLSEKVSEKRAMGGNSATIAFNCSQLSQNSLTGWNARLLASEQTYMKQRFYLFKRGEVYYLQDGLTGKQHSLQTRNRTEAERLWHARNEATASPGLNRALARVYLSANDSKMLTRTWQDVIDEFCSRGQPQTQAFRKRKAGQQAFALIRRKPLVETTAEDVLALVKTAGVMGSACFRSMHNLAIGLGWLPGPILSPKLWPTNQVQIKRGITWDEHSKILAAEMNPERRLYYDMLWETGTSQSDAATLHAENIDWTNRLLHYRRMKTGTSACLAIGPRLEGILRALPAKGPLFPSLGVTTVNARSAEFWRRCKLLGLRGISLHSYRYAWAERAKVAGYPERFAQEALGHNSKAVHRAYARRAQATIPSLEEYQNQRAEKKIIALPSIDTPNHQNQTASGT